MRPIRKVFLRIAVWVAAVLAKVGASTMRWSTPLQNKPAAAVWVGLGRRILLVCLSILVMGGLCFNAVAQAAISSLHLPPERGTAAGVLASAPSADSLETRATSREHILPAKCYLFAYFSVGDSGLHLAYSVFGYRWNVMDGGRIFLHPEIGEEKLMRDPFLWRDTNGLFHLVWTMGWSGNAIGYANSKDLMHWSEQRALPVMAGEPSTLNCWAPETFWDERSGQYLIFWASRVAKKSAEANDALLAGQPPNRIYATTTKDFQTFTPTRLLYDSSSGANDPTLFAARGKYYLMFTKGRDNRLTVVTSDNPFGPFQNPESRITPKRALGPTTFHLGDRYAVCFAWEGDRYYGACVSSDLEQWEDASSAMSFPSDAQQGSILEVPGEALRAIAEAGRMGGGRTPEAAALGVGDWIWTTNVTDKQTCRFWRDFTIPIGSRVTHATLRMTADNGYTVYLDGREIGRSEDANCLTDYDVSWLLSPGSHAIAVEAFNNAMDAGMLLGLRVDLASGKRVEVLSDSAWNVADNDVPGWQTCKQPRPSWIQAQVVGYAGEAWWRYPRTIIRTAPLLPAAGHFWQRTWFLSLVLGAFAVGAVFTVRQTLQLAVKTRSNRLLARAVEDRTQELRHSQENLEHQVVARTTELRRANELLEQDIAKRKLAEEALQKAQAALVHVTRVTTLGEVAGSIAHELNQPLTAIANNGNACLGLLSSGQTGLEEMREALADIVRDAERGGAIIERVRGMARRSVPQRAPLRLAEVVNDIVGLTAAESVTRGIVIHTEVAPDLPMVQGDRVQLQQVLLNLVVNGMDAMSTVTDRERRLDILGQPDTQDGHPAIRITVRDRGLGLNAGEADKLFEAFYTTKPHGMGLGLAICRSIVEAHGGRLWAAPNAPTGVTFEFSLPMAEHGEPDE